MATAKPKEKPAVMALTAPTSSPVQFSLFVLEREVRVSCVSNARDVNWLLVIYSGTREPRDPQYKNALPQEGRLMVWRYSPLPLKPGFAGLPILRADHNVGSPTAHISLRR